MTPEVVGDTVWGLPTKVQEELLAEADGVLGACPLDPDPAGSPPVLPGGAVGPLAAPGSPSLGG